MPVAAAVVGNPLLAAALAGLDMTAELAVDVCDLQRRHLGDAQAGTIGDRKRGLVLEAGWGIEEPGHVGVVALSVK